MDVVENMADLLQEKDLELFAMIAKGIWKRRNGVVLGGPFIHPNVVAAEAASSLQQFHKANTKPSDETITPTIPKPIWVPPSFGFF